MNNKFYLYVHFGIVLQARQSFRNLYAQVIFIFLHTSFSKLQSRKMVVGGGSAIFEFGRGFYGNTYTPVLSDLTLTPG